MTNIAVIDFGKTNVKVALVRPSDMAEIAVRRMPNRARPAPPFAHYDTDGHWAFLLDALTALHREHGIKAISVTTHGATAALVDGAGALVLPVLDYEDPAPETLAADYAHVRPPFSETGSPRLAAGLNLGAQLHWLFRTHPETARTQHILTYPQYWAFRLCGVAASEGTSLGCHTDLWQPARAEFSGLVDAMGWRGLMPPLRRTGDVLGAVLPEISAQTGLDPETPVHCGIHDSNASLYPHLLLREGPFSVVSTGTWVVCMAAEAADVTLDPGRDTLMNVDALGRPVPSARFMGGREYEIMRGTDEPVSEADRAAVLTHPILLLPAVEPETGPFRGRRASWSRDPETGGERALALSWYLALMTAECLSIIAARGPVVVEGPFARNPDYLQMLAAATGRSVETNSGHSTGTSFGAALLATGPVPRQEGTLTLPDPDLAAYADTWRQAVAATEPA